MTGSRDVSRSRSAARVRLVGIFIIALVAIAYQVLLTRIFSVMLYYHFAFFGISLAMLGITIGAVKVYLKPNRFAPERFEEEWAKAALGFAVSSVLLVLWFLCAPFIVPAELSLILTGSMLLFTIPFRYSGICVTLTLTQSHPAGKVYAADLIGAALGCVGIVALLYILDPVTIVFLLAALSAYTAWYTAREGSARIARKCTIVLIVMLVAAAVQGTLYLSQREHLGVTWAKGAHQHHVLFERWNTFSLVRVMSLTKRLPFGWGFGHSPTQEIEQKYLDIDASAGTIITRFDGNLKPLSFLADDVVNAGYTLRPVQSVVVIGVGGGRDVLSALYFGVKHIFAIELNPSIIEALTDTFADFTGHFIELPQVSLINAEARSWITRHRPAADLIQISLIDTWAATAAGGLALTENRLYTLEAWKEFFRTLKPNGMLEVSRWYRPSYKGEFYRLLSLAAESLKAQGVPRSEIRRHIFVFNAGSIATIVVSPTVFTPAETAHSRRMAKDKGYNVLVAPDFAPDEISRTIVSGEATRTFYEKLPINVTASTDDNPFFFLTTRFPNPFAKKIASQFGPIHDYTWSYLIILLLGTIVLTAAFVIQPLVNVFGRIPLKGILSDLGYFAGIGFGFMLIEISQMQRLMVFLGDPVFGLSVVLFALLLFAGIGSATVHANAGTVGLWKRPLSLCLILFAVGLLMPIMTAQFVAYGTGVRILVSIIMLAPAGLFMGMMFPIGMIASAGHREFQPWFWGINGAVSVFASIFGMMLSMQYGIAATYWAGVGAYVWCLLIVVKNRRRAA